MVATHTTIDALGCLDAALQDQAAGMWEAVAHVARDPEAVAAAFGRAEGLIRGRGDRCQQSEIAHRARLHSATSATDAA